MQSREAQKKRRAADIAFEIIENMISTLEMKPGAPVFEADIVEKTGLGRTPVREALLRMISTGLIIQQPRRGLLVSNIDLGEYLDVIRTRRVLESLIASCSARRATVVQRESILKSAEIMLVGAKSGDLDLYIKADQMLDIANHDACQNMPAVKCIVPLIVQCKRFWYAYQQVGDVVAGARAHLELAQGIYTGDEQKAVKGVNELMDYLELYAKRILNN